ncbi:hypothetical protein [Hymenobacter sp. CRA2]|uniref:hypothetical protein n=1 Tax=Hymenobacter sp. CRA2 TaxID=1955620 RepID=UPI00098FC4B7|nr:hypothetical protein [Hymenobacter sp. CRA2]OON69998.1 hypothetical protein B0919_04430 [Hymenobacter sp. CRA2]
MTAANPTMGFLSPDEFRPVLAAMVGLPVWAAWMKSYELYIGRKHTIKLHSLGPRPNTGAVIEQDFSDLNLQLGSEWVIVKQGRIVDKKGSKSGGWFKEPASIGSLTDLQIVDVVLDANLSLCITFADGQRLLTDNAWCLDTLFTRTRYEPMAAGGIRTTALNANGDIGNYIRSLTADASS